MEELDKDEGMEGAGNSQIDTDLSQINTNCESDGESDGAELDAGEVEVVIDEVSEEVLEEKEGVAETNDDSEVIGPEEINEVGTDEDIVEEAAEKDVSEEVEVNEAEEMVEE